MDLNYITRLTPRIGMEWYMLGVELGFRTTQLDHLRSAYPHAISECISSMLSEWYKVAIQVIPDPSVILSEAFRNVERADISFDINKDFEPTNNQIKQEDISRIKKRMTEITFRRKSNNFDVFYYPSKCCIETFEKENQHRFVQTSVSETATTELKATKHVTIIGNAGDGKTTVVMFLLHQLNQGGYYPIILSDPGLIEQVYDPDKKIVYFVDDAFGTPTLNRNLVETWIRLHGKISALISDGNCHLIIASRKQTYLKALNFIQDYPCFVDTVIDLTSPKYQLTPIEKKNIITCYFPDQATMFPKHHINPPLVYIPGFPLLCKLYSKHGKAKNPSTFFEKPVAFLQRQFSIMAKTDQESYCALVLVMFYDGKLPNTIFDPFDMEEKDKNRIKTIIQACGVDAAQSFSKIEKCLQSLIGVYLSQDEDEYYVFLHDSIFDAVCLDFGQKFPKQVLEVATPEFIASRVRTDSQGEPELLDIPEVIHITRKHYKSLVERWIVDIKNRNIKSVFDNPCSRNKEVLKCIVKQISAFTDSDIEAILQIKDHDSSVTLLELLCRRGLSEIIEELFKCRAVRNCVRTDILALSFLEAVRHDHKKIVNLILNLEPNIHRAKLKNATQAIHIASENGNYNMVKLLLEAGTYVSAKDLYKMQAIHIVCKNGSSECLSMLLKSGASCSSRDISNFEPIHYACKSGSLECLKILMENGANMNSVNMYNKNPVHYASASGNPDVLKYVLTQSPDLKTVDENGNTCLHFAVHSKVLENVDQLLRTDCDPNIKNILGNTPLHILCSNSWADQNQGYKCLEALVNNGANVNIADNRSRTPLHLACSWSHDLRFEFVKFLIEKGANVALPDNDGNLALTYAFNSKSCKCAKLIIDKGGYSNIALLDPIHHACANGGYDILTALYDKGFDLNTTDRNGKCPIHLASQYGHRNCLIFLLDNGVDPNVRDGNGQTPLHYTCKWGKTACTELLIERGADTSMKDNANRLPIELVPPTTISAIFTTNPKV